MDLTPGTLADIGEEPKPFTLGTSRLGGPDVLGQDLSKTPSAQLLAELTTRLTRLERELAEASTPKRLWEESRQADVDWLRWRSRSDADVADMANEYDRLTAKADGPGLTDSEAGWLDLIESRMHRLRMVDEHQHPTPSRDDYDEIPDAARRVTDKPPSVGEWDEGQDLGGSIL